MIKVKKFSFFIAEFSKRNIKHVFYVSRVTETQVKVLENLKKLWKHSPLGSCSHSISRSTKLPLVFHNSTIYKGNFRDKLNNNDTVLSNKGNLPRKNKGNLPPLVVKGYMRSDSLFPTWCCIKLHDCTFRHDNHFFVCSFVGWLVGWLAGSFVRSLIDWSVGWLARSFTRSLVDWLVGWFVHFSFTLILWLGWNKSCTVQTYLLLPQQTHFQRVKKLYE